MACLLPHSVFIHIPKTAGQWVAAALENAALMVGRLGVVHASPDEISHDPAFQQRSVVFTMVRHPLSWYQSMWAHRMDEDWTPIDDLEWFTPRWIETWAEFTEYCRATRFDEFIRKCTAQFPNGFVSMLYEAYTAGCTFVGAQERLPDDLLRALQLAGERFRPEKIRATLSRNVRARNPRRLAQCRYTPELIELILTAETQAIRRFGFQEIPPGILQNAVSSAARRERPVHVAPVDNTSFGSVPPGRLQDDPKQRSRSCGGVGGSLSVIPWNLEYVAAHDLRIRQDARNETVARSKFLGRQVPLDDLSRTLLERFAAPAVPDKVLKSIQKGGGPDGREFLTAFTRLEQLGFLHLVSDVLDRPVVMISAPRSGSTLLYETLCQASEFWNIGGESHFVIESFPTLQVERRGYESHRLDASDADPATSRALAASFITYLRDRDGNRYLELPPAKRPRRIRFLEKTPRNALRVSFLNAVFPDGLFIFLYRDPRDGISSIMEAWRAPGFWQFKGNLPGWDREEWCMLLPPGWRELKGRPLEEIAAFQWRVSNELAMDDLSKIPRDRWIAIDYAEFLANARDWLERLCAFVGVSYDERLARLATQPLRPSSSTVTPPGKDKWQKNAGAIHRVLPSVQPVMERLRALAAACSYSRQ